MIMFIEECELKPKVVEVLQENEIQYLNNERVETGEIRFMQ